MGQVGCVLWPDVPRLNTFHGARFAGTMTRAAARECDADDTQVVPCVYRPSPVLQNTFDLQMMNLSRFMKRFHFPALLA